MAQQPVNQWLNQGQMYHNRPLYWNFYNRPVASVAAENLPSVQYLREKNEQYVSLIINHTYNRRNLLRDIRLKLLNDYAKSLSELWGIDWTIQPSAIADTFLPYGRARAVTPLGPGANAAARVIRRDFEIADAMHARIAQYVWFNDSQARPMGFYRLNYRKRRAMRNYYLKYIRALRDHQKAPRSLRLRKLKARRNAQLIITSENITPTNADLTVSLAFSYPLFDGNAIQVAPVEFGYWWTGLALALPFVSFSPPSRLQTVKAYLFNRKLKGRIAFPPYDVTKGATIGASPEFRRKHDMQQWLADLNIWMNSNIQRQRQNLPLSGFNWGRENYPRADKLVQMINGFLSPGEAPNYSYVLMFDLVIRLKSFLPGMPIAKQCYTWLNIKRDDQLQTSSDLEHPVPAPTPQDLANLDRQDDIDDDQDQQQQQQQQLAAAAAAVPTTRPPSTRQRRVPLRYQDTTYQPIQHRRGPATRQTSRMPPVFAPSAIQVLRRSTRRARPGAVLGINTRLSPPRRRRAATATPVATTSTAPRRSTRQRQVSSRLDSRIFQLSQLSSRLRQSATPSSSGASSSRRPTRQRRVPARLQGTTYQPTSQARSGRRQRRGRTQRTAAPVVQLTIPQSTTQTAPAVTRRTYNTRPASKRSRPKRYQ